MPQPGLHLRQASGVGSLGPSRGVEEGADPVREKVRRAGLSCVLTPFSQESHSCIQAGGRDVDGVGGATELKDLGTEQGVHHRTGTSLVRPRAIRPGDNKTEPVA